VISRGRAGSTVEVDTEGRGPSSSLCGDQPALLVRGSSATNHCHAAPAPPTREYQADDRRCFLTSAVLPVLAPLDKDFHIRERIAGCPDPRWLGRPRQRLAHGWEHARAGGDNSASSGLRLGPPLDGNPLTRSAPNRSSLLERTEVAV
jgi:hypothetical protein